MFNFRTHFAAHSLVLRHLAYCPTRPTLAPHAPRTYVLRAFHARAFSRLQDVACTAHTRPCVHCLMPPRARLAVCACCCARLALLSCFPQARPCYCHSLAQGHKPSLGISHQGLRRWHFPRLPVNPNISHGFGSTKNENANEIQSETSLQHTHQLLKKRALKKSNILVDSQWKRTGCFLKIFFSHSRKHNIASVWHHFFLTALIKKNSTITSL